MLLDKGEAPRTFNEHLKAYIFQKCPCERSVQTLTIREPHYLPIPFPRVLSNITANGLATVEGEESSFYEQMPSLTKLTLDGTYLGHVEEQYKKLKCITLKTRQNLLANNDHMEEDDYREKVENLKQLTEAYKMIALGEEPDSEEDVGSDDY